MEIHELAAIGYSAATAVFACLCVLTLSRWKNRPKAAFIALASGATAIWAGIHALGAVEYLHSPLILPIVECVRGLSWIIALATIMRELDQTGQARKLALRYGAGFLVAAAILIIYYVVRSPDAIGTKVTVTGAIMMSALILVLVEQICRNAPFDARSGLRYLSVGVGGIFLYDLVIFTLLIANGEMNVDHWAARGFVNAMFALPIALAAKRSFRLSLDVHLPRQIIFYSFAMITVSMFVIFILVGDYYVNTYAGTWGGIVRIVLFASAILALAVLMVSATIRARVRVFLMKSFFQYKYDYRKEWLRFIGTLSESALDNVATAAVRSVAQIVNSSGGVVWIQEDNGKNYLPVGTWETDLPVTASVNSKSSLIRFLRGREWVIDIKEMLAEPARYEGLELDSWILEHEDWWLVVPLMLGERLFGFMILEQSRIATTLNFEDHDLLRTVGRHVATHIDQAESDRRLAESSQFGAYNRLTAFLMHDLNNLIAQQSLVVKNAEKYRHNPEFVDDTIKTIANSVSRMRHLMEQLSNRTEPPMRTAVDLHDVLRRAVKNTEPRLPRPAMNFPDNDVQVIADAERLCTVVEHLVRNALDATDDDGHVTVGVSVEGPVAAISLGDDGCGMSPEFIRERLYRPFDSTKGSQSMGIGAYQAREYIRQLGGQLDVRSTPQVGTTFTVRLPLA